MLVRSDILLHQQMVQACRAALEAGFVFDAPARTSSLIVLTVQDVHALEAARDRLGRYGIDCEVFFEPDWGMGHSALCTQPVFKKKQRFALAKYPLFTGIAALITQECNASD